MVSLSALFQAGIFQFQWRWWRNIKPTYEWTEWSVIPFGALCVKPEKLILKNLIHEASQNESRQKIINKTEAFTIKLL